MTKTLAIVGAGRGIGMALAERFGREGFNVALLARNATALTGFVEALRAQGIEAAAFPADVLDRPGLTIALQKAISHFGAIDVLEYGPSTGPDSLRTPRNFTVENEQFHLDLALLGAITAVQTVLPGMLERKDGGLLFTIPASALFPVTFTASRCVAAGALLNYARVLNRDLAADGVYAGVAPISGLIVDGDQKAEVLNNHNLSLITSREVGQHVWDLYTRRDKAESVIGDLDALLKMAGA